MNIFKIEGQNELHIVGTRKLLSDEELKEIALKNKVENEQARNSYLEDRITKLENLIKQL